MNKLAWKDQDKENFALILSGLLACLVIVALFSIVALIVTRGLAHFWVQPAYFVSVSEARSTNRDHTELNDRFLFAMIQERDIASDKVQRVWLRESTYQSGNGGRPNVVAKEQITYLDRPKNLANIGMNDGSFLLAIPRVLSTPEGQVGVDAFDAIYNRVVVLRQRIEGIHSEHLMAIHEQLAAMRLSDVDDSAPAYVKALHSYQFWELELEKAENELGQFQLSVNFANGTEIQIPLAEVQFIQFPNAVSNIEKVQYFLNQLWLFVSDSPKQAITAGGVFPALFGTVLMVMLMTVMVTPFGVLAAIYLAEYAPNNSVVSIIRIAVSNLAGVPSIVYGVFGLGFFVYTVGGQLDSLLYPERSDAAVFGAPGLLWASLTMALLTLPVVIVATEEGLRRVPLALRQGSYALGATKYETIRLTVLPIATPGIMTGVILAIARGAGEVAPLLMLGAVKFALLLPVDGDFPFIHLERQFMHLGVLIYDGAFHSQYAGGEAGLMFAACMLLLVVVLVLNTIAVRVRNRLRLQYRVLIGQ